MICSSMDLVTLVFTILCALKPILFAPNDRIIWQAVALWITKRRAKWLMSTPYVMQITELRVKFHGLQFSVIKIVSIVYLLVYYTIPFGFHVFLYFWGVTFHLFNWLFLLWITDDGYVPEMCICSILLIKSDLKWCIHLTRSLFSYL